MTYCAHRQAEPVILSTGEVVACVCVACYAQLPARYIRDQYDKALLYAYCKHKDRVDLAELGKEPVNWDQICQGCGQIMRAHQWDGIAYGNAWLRLEALDPLCECGDPLSDHGDRAVQACTQTRVSTAKVMAENPNAYHIQPCDCTGFRKVR